jgi:hypothetical protein
MHRFIKDINIHTILPAIFTEQASFPYLDALTTVMSFTAMWLIAHKRIESWYYRDANAAQNIRAEGIRMIKAEGSVVSAVGGEVRPKLGRKSKLRHSPVSTEAQPSGEAKAG